MSNTSSFTTLNSSSAAQRKKQEENNSKILRFFFELLNFFKCFYRELLALPANKFCFECGQRGPMYANITNGSFCCMHCSGLL